MASSRGPAPRPGRRFARSALRLPFRCLPLRRASCASYAEPRGVRRIEGKIVDVHAATARTATSTSVTLESGAADRGRSVHRLLGLSRAADRADARRPAMRTGSHWLPCDRAIAVPTRQSRPARSRSPAPPRTASGWQWRIPLQHRMGNGHRLFERVHRATTRPSGVLLANLEGEPLAEPRRLIASPPAAASSRGTRTWSAMGLSSGLRRAARIDQHPPDPERRSPG